MHKHLFTFCYISLIYVTGSSLYNLPLDCDTHKIDDVIETIL